MLLVAGSSWWLAIQPIYQSYRQIQQLTANAIYDLRTPLAAIQATVELGLTLSSLTLIQVENTRIGIAWEEHRRIFGQV